MDDRWFRPGDHGRYPVRQMGSMKFTTRSLLVSICTVALMLALFAVVPGDQPFTPFLAIFIYSVGWMVVGSSFGYDSKRSKVGAVKGALVGLALCFLTMLFFATCLPYP